MSICVYVREWNVDFYYNLAKEVFPNSKILTVSEFKGSGDIWLTKNIYTNLPQYPIFSLDEIIDIATRCRFLRNLSIEKSIVLINKMANNIQNIFENQNVKVFVGVLIDNYTLDIIERLCIKNKIEYLSLVGHFFNGYCRISSRGELRITRDIIEDDEIEMISNLLLNNSYKPNFELNKEKKIKDIYYEFFREKLKSSYFNSIKKMKHDRYNYHYNTQRFMNTRISDVIIRKKEKIFYTLDELIIMKNDVYLPLHYTPEATVDYWCDNYHDALYEDSIIQMIYQSSNEIRFLIKEHPAMYMKRNKKFYKKLELYNNVKLIHPYENSNEIIEKVENVYVYTGSVGVEAVLRGKRVFTKTNNYYSSLSNNIHSRDYLVYEDLNLNINDTDNKEFIRRLLKGLIPTSFVNSKNIDKNNKLKISEYIQMYLSR